MLLSAKENSAMCFNGAHGSMSMIWSLHLNLRVFWNSLVVQGSFLFYTGKCIMSGDLRTGKAFIGKQPGTFAGTAKGIPFDNPKRALSVKLPRAAEKAPYLNLHCCR